MGALALFSQVFLAYGTFLAYPAGGALACAGLIATGFPVYWYFLHKQRNTSTP
jgi:hypothetical protein